MGVKIKAQEEKIRNQKDDLTEITSKYNGETDDENKKNEEGISDLNFVRVGRPQY